MSTFPGGSPDRPSFTKKTTSVVLSSPSEPTFVDTEPAFSSTVRVAFGSGANFPGSDENVPTFPQKTPDYSRNIFTGRVAPGPYPVVVYPSPLQIMIPCDIDGTNPVLTYAISKIYFYRGEDEVTGYEVQITAVTNCTASIIENIPPEVQIESIPDLVDVCTVQCIAMKPGELTIHFMVTGVKVKANIASLTFLGLTDTPSDYAASGGFMVRVRNDQTGLEYKSTVNFVQVDQPGQFGFATLGKITPAPEDGILVEDRSDLFNRYGYVELTDISPLYTNITPMPEEVGGYEVGSTFTDQDNQEMWDGLLYPYQYPAFLSFLISGQGQTLECGVDTNGGVQTFTWSTSNPSNISTNSIDIWDVTGSSQLAGSQPNSGSLIIDIGAAITQDIHNEYWDWRIDAENTKAQTISRTFRVRFYSPTYYGVGAPGLSVAAVQGLTKAIQAKANRTYAFSPSSEVYYYAYPASFGLLTSILDANGFETIGDWTLSVVSFTNNPPDYEGIATNYNVYEFDNLTTQTAFNNTFIF